MLMAPRKRRNAPNRGSGISRDVAIIFMASGWKRLSSELMEPNEEVMLESCRNLLSLGAAVRHSVSQDKVQWPSSTAHDSSDNLLLPKSQSRKSALVPLRRSAPVKFLSQHMLRSSWTCVQKIPSSQGGSAQGIGSSRVLTTAAGRRWLQTPWVSTEKRQASRAFFSPF